MYMLFMCIYIYIYIYTFITSEHAIGNHEKNNSKARQANKQITAREETKGDSGSVKQARTNNKQTNNANSN